MVTSPPFNSNAGSSWGPGLGSWRLLGFLLRSNQGSQGTWIIEVINHTRNLSFGLEMRFNMCISWQEFFHIDWTLDSLLFCALLSEQREIFRHCRACFYHTCSEWTIMMRHCWALFSSQMGWEDVRWAKQTYGGYSYFLTYLYWIIFFFFLLGLLLWPQIFKLWS